mgnify:CR=1 FL=1
MLKQIITKIKNFFRKPNSQTNTLTKKLITAEEREVFALTTAYKAQAEYIYSFYSNTLPIEEFLYQRGVWSVERTGNSDKQVAPSKASKREIRTWINNGSVIVNGEKAKVGEVYSIKSLILFPKNSRKRTTLI